MPHPNGKLTKTNKATLSKILEKMFVTSNVLEDPNVIIFDEFALLHTLKNLPLSLGELSERILRIITNNTARRVDIIFDTYPMPSIKDFEHQLRGARAINFQLSGRQQSRPANFNSSLKSIKFKTAFVNFLIEDWSEDDRAGIIGNKFLYVNHEKCLLFKAENNSVIVKDCQELTSSQPEADTKIALHMCNLRESSANVREVRNEAQQQEAQKKVPQKDIKKIKVRASDTDILVILLANIKNMQNTDDELWMELGVGNKRRFVDVSGMQ